MGFFSIFRSMLERNTEDERQELQEILKKEDYEKSKEKLENLALRVGATTYVLDEYHIVRSADVPQLIHNIHLALQTKSMIATVKTTSNYVIVNIILAVIALGGVIANFIMALR